MGSIEYGGFPKLGVPFWGSQDKEYSILGSILGSPHFGKLPYRGHGKENGNDYLGFDIPFPQTERLQPLAKRLLWVVCVFRV